MTIGPQGVIYKRTTNERRYSEKTSKPPASGKSAGLVVMDEISNIQVGMDFASGADIGGVVEFTEGTFKLWPQDQITADTPYDTGKRDAMQLLEFNDSEFLTDVGRRDYERGYVEQMNRATAMGEGLLRFQMDLLAIPEAVRRKMEE